jgi:excisionase family DNA binding protein
MLKLVAGRATIGEMAEETAYLTVEEAAKRARVHLDTFRRYVREGRLPSRRLGKRYLIVGSDLEHFITAGFVPPTASPSRSSTIPLPIQNIRTDTFPDSGPQPRGALDYDVIDSYQDAMENGAVFPALDVFYDGTVYWLADGFHRLQASYQADREEVECTLHQGTLEDAQWFRLGANKMNGLYLSVQDRTGAVRVALSHPRAAELSNAQIAKYCGTSQEIVAEIRENPTKKNKPAKRARKTPMIATSPE